MSAIIVTATLSPPDFAWADALRRVYYPADRNQVPAHITLFHHLPPSIEVELVGRLKAIVAQPPPVATLSGLIDLGPGIAFRIDSPDLTAIRDDLADAFAGLLMPQDAQSPRLHITVQNKAPRVAAKTLLAELSATFRPRPIRIAGLAAWRYLGGPWERIRECRFRG